jgi:HAD superfamily hydrolase (TIGR01484 family)
MTNMERKQVNAILSDYDGTLCSTTSVRDNTGLVDTISRELEQLLFHISEHIPLCIISSKDFSFLHKRAKFANIISCVLGIETVIHDSHYGDNEINNSCIRYRHLNADNHLLKDTSTLLQNVVEILQNQNYKEIMIEEKYTFDNKILIGLTLDYRHLENWKLFKETREPNIIEIIQRSITENLRPNLSTKDRPYIQTYSSHPFLDVYGVKCNKGLAFDSVLSQLEEREGKGGNVMYLGDSENDNPAFRKSDISIGIRSDSRLNPTLDCKYIFDFSQLSLFLRSLVDNNLLFSEDLLPARPIK